MAENIVAAFVEHDRKNYEKSAEHFSKVYRGPFPKYGEGSASMAN